MKSTYQVKIGRRGKITLPKALRDRHNIAAGEILNLFELTGDTFVINRRRSQFDEVANQLAREWQDSGVSLESMLTTLRSVRAAYREGKL